jgi:hypothetical protein
MTIIAIIGYQGYNYTFTSAELATSKHYIMACELIDVDNAEFVLETIKIILNSNNIEKLWKLIDLHRANRNHMDAKNIIKAIETLSTNITEIFERCFLKDDSNKSSIADIMNEIDRSLCNINSSIPVMSSVISAIDEIDQSLCNINNNIPRSL